MKLPKWMQNISVIKQGITNKNKIDIRLEFNSDEFETYIDPNCGCRKTRKKQKHETNELVHSDRNEQVWSEDESSKSISKITKRKSRKTLINKS